MKRLLFHLLRKDPEPIIVCFATGDPDLSARMFAEIQALTPDRRHDLVTPGDLDPGSALQLYSQLRKRFARQRIGLAPVLFTADSKYRPLRIAACLLAPRKILAYNGRLERHHLRLRTWIASLLFLRGIPLDRIWLRPRWLVPWKKDRSVYPAGYEEFDGREFGDRARVAIVTPYFPYPLSHGGAVRMFYLLRETAKEFDIILLAFRDQETAEDLAPILGLCARVLLVRKPRYREPRWSTLLPPEVHEFRSKGMAQALEKVRREYQPSVLQVEYTFLAPYRGDILVEHDVTFALYRQVSDRERTLSSRWDSWRWRRFETRWATRYRQVVVMSHDDAKLLPSACTAVIPNGVDLDRFAPGPERGGATLLFIGSFRHFPNVVAFRFFFENVWPIVCASLPDVKLLAVAGADPERYWTEHTGLPHLPQGDRITIHGFTADVRPLYLEANLVIVPTLVSAGTNLKVLEALAMERAVVSTSSGCQGLGLQHGTNIWIANTAPEFADAIEMLLADTGLRQRVAIAGRAHVEHNFGWDQIGVRQRALIRTLMNGTKTVIRSATPDDLPQIVTIERAAFGASQWKAEDFLPFDCNVAYVDGRLAAFLVSRQVAPGEREILNVAVHPDYRRQGVAETLIRWELESSPGTHFLEVRESNTPARSLYEKIGFRQVGVRPEYYDNPTEPGIVMRIFS